MPKQKPCCKNWSNTSILQLIHEIGSRAFRNAWFSRGSRKPTQILNYRGMENGVCAESKECTLLQIVCQNDVTFGIQSHVSSWGFLGLRETYTKQRTLYSYKCQREWMSEVRMIMKLLECVGWSKLLHANLIYVMCAAPINTHIIYINSTYALWMVCAKSKHNKIVTSTNITVASIL